MTSEAMIDIGPSAQIASRIRRARDELAMAELRLEQHETAAALRRLQRAAEAAAPKLEN